MADEQVAKRRRKGPPPPKQFCYVFAHERQCRFGEECRFHHDLKDFLGPLQWDFYEAQMQHAAGVATHDGKRDKGWYIPPPFTKAFDTKPGQESTSVLFVHENAIVGVCMGESHPALVGNSAVVLVKQAGEQGAHVRTNDVLCTVHLEDGREFALRCPVPGKLVQFNPRLGSEPGLVMNHSKHRENRGFVCLIKASEPYPLMFDYLFTPRRYNI